MRPHRGSRDPPASASARYRPMKLPETSALSSGEDGPRTTPRSRGAKTRTVEDIVMQRRAFPWLFDGGGGSGVGGVGGSGGSGGGGGGGGGGGLGSDPSLTRLAASRQMARRGGPATGGGGRRRPQTSDAPDHRRGRGGGRSSPLHRLYMASVQQLQEQASSASLGPVEGHQGMGQDYRSASAASFAGNEYGVGDGSSINSPFFQVSERGQPTRTDMSLCIFCPPVILASDGLANYFFYVLTKRFPFHASRCLSTPYAPNTSHTKQTNKQTNTHARSSLSSTASFRWWTSL